MERDTAKNAALQKRISHFRKAFAKGLGHKPTTLQAAAIDRAAKLTAEAERALTDPAVSINDKVRIDGAASRARADMTSVLAGKPTKQLGPDALRQYLASKREAVSA